MNLFKGRHFTRDVILWAVRWYWRNPSGLSPWHIDETYVKVNGRWAYLYRAVDSRGRTLDFYLSPRRNTKAAYRFLGKILNNVKRWQIPRYINTDKAPTYNRFISVIPWARCVW